MTPTVLVHGNPETPALWDPLVVHLQRDVVRPAPPGFGAPLPAGFGATVPEYRDWLVGELERLGEPVDLVGHDWGGVHVVAVAMARPDLLRSWVSDAVGVFDEDYRWHDLAEQWQQPGVGEESIAQLLGGSAADKAARLVSFGFPPATAEQVAAGQDDDMGRAVLALYRSAAQPVMAEAGRSLEAAAARPGLALLASEDAFVGTDAQRRRAAGRAGARVEVLDGLGHWWMVQDPQRSAAVLERFWAGL
ncbi:alpha/beta fold hydrolase [Geodermatophilus sp. DSM 45219]|uniref:alpha/beta fold hydrolase n=1 Tax=Geodermatophilus sp. DSM 45219 TaxID=1881103 RepID=UPI0008808657|nr:alpha/beta hydrolase [Geodermatophilus sp. DSM 45219]SDO44120.1 Pimeloyl-ACP methyl ester carboxylesterase [Geodermatophilus sp. DSM 45219]